MSICSRPAHVHGAWPVGELTAVSAYAMVASRLALIDAAVAAGTLSEGEQRRLYDAEADSEFARAMLGYHAPLSLGDFLDAVGRGFVCPLTDTPLCPDGAARPLTVHARTHARTHALPSPSR